MPVPALGYGWFSNVPQSRVNEVRKTMMTNPGSLEWITPALWDYSLFSGGFGKCCTWTGQSLLQLPRLAPRRWSFL